MKNIEEAQAVDGGVSDSLEEVCNDQKCFHVKLFKCLATHNLSQGIRCKSDCIKNIQCAHVVDFVFGDLLLGDCPELAIEVHTHVAEIAYHEDSRLGNP